MPKYKALKDYPSSQLNRMVKKGEEIELDYTFDEIKQHFGENFVTPIKKTRAKKVVEEGEE